MLMDDKSFGGKNVEDLLELSELSEQIFISTLQNRYNMDLIYTCIGESVLVSLNPFKILKSYDLELEFQPEKRAHLFALAKNALQNLDRYRKNQSVVISGESGSGKTESTKILLRYLSSQNKKDEGGYEKQQGRTIEQSVVDNNVILEAFGNAKTMRNDNSSRFGKFIKVSLGVGGIILQANIESYLLERSRVTSISSSERNYHIFYQLLRGASQEQKQKYFLEDISKYEYLKFGDTLNNFSDSSNFDKVQSCFKFMNFSNDEVDDLLSVISAILQLGNMTSSITGDSDFSFISDGDKYLQQAASLLKLSNSNVLKNAVCNPQIQDPSSKTLISTNQSKLQAKQNVESLCKILYGTIFDWIIVKVNKALSPESNDKYQEDLPKSGYINILDIFGFEIFQRNSFEQLCINYANEKLQCAFNDTIFMSEQKEYLEEGIPWKNIEFKENQVVIDLFESNTGCIFGFLDDECRRRDGNDGRFISQVKSNLLQKALAYCKDQTFAVKHYAGQVEYQVNGFVDKNRDQPNQAIQSLLSVSQNGILMNKFSVEAGMNQQGGNKKGSVSSMFRIQLKTLLAELKESTNFYVRCIKPNTLKAANNFDMQEIKRQVECAGLMETVQIRKSGYSLRFKYEDFLRRYGVLANELESNKKNKVSKSYNYNLSNYGKNTTLQNKTEKCKHIMQSVATTLYQLGKTKIFFNEKARDIIEKNLIKLQEISVRTIQRAIRRYLERKRKRVLKIILKIQRIHRYKKFRVIQQQKIQERLRREEEERVRKAEEERQRREQEEKLRKYQQEKEQREEEEREKIRLEQQKQKVLEECLNMAEGLKNKSPSHWQHENEQESFSTPKQESDYAYDMKYGLNDFNNMKVSSQQQYQISSDQDNFNYSPYSNNNYQYNNNNIKSNSNEGSAANGTSLKSSFFTKIESEIRLNPQKEIFGSTSPHLDESPQVTKHNEFYQSSQFNVEYMPSQTKQLESDKQTTIPEYAPTKSNFNYQASFNDPYSYNKANNNGQDPSNKNNTSEWTQNNNENKNQNNYLSANIQNWVSAANFNSDLSTFTPPMASKIMNYHDASEIIPTGILTSIKENEIMEILRQKSRLFCPPSALASFSMSNYLSSVNNINEFLQLVQTQIMHQAKDILELRETLTQEQERLEKKEQSEYELENKLDQNLLKHAMETERLRQEIQSLKNTTNNSYAISKNESSRINELEDELRMTRIEMEAIRSMNVEQMTKQTELKQEKLRMERQKNKEEGEKDSLQKIIKKLKQKDAYNEKVLQGVFKVIKDKDEELDLLKASFKGNEHLLPSQQQLDSLLQKQQESLQKLHSLYKHPHKGGDVEEEII